MNSGHIAWIYMRRTMFLILATGLAVAGSVEIADADSLVLLPANQALFSKSQSTSHFIPTDLVVYRLTQDEPLPAAAQVDERNHNGDYVLENGIPYTAGGGDGVYNRNDELVILIPEIPRPAHAKLKAKNLQRWIVKHHGEPSRAWRVTLNCASDATTINTPDRVDIDRGELLVIAASQHTSGSKVAMTNRVAFDPIEKSITTKNYRYVFNKTNPASIGSLTMFSGPSEPYSSIKMSTIITGGEFGFWLKPPWLFPVIAGSGKDAAGAIESWRSGPVRTIVAVGNQYSAFWSIIKAHLFSEVVFYPDRMQIPSVIDIPFSPQHLLGSGSGFAYGLKLEGALSDISRTIDQNGAKVTVSSRPTEDRDHGRELTLQARVDERLAANGALPKLWIPARPTSDSDRKMAAIEDDTVPTKVREWFLENSATAGFFVDISQIHAGTYDFLLDLESHVEADKSHTDFLTCKSVWTEVESHQTVRPAK